MDLLGIDAVLVRKAPSSHAKHLTSSSMIGMPPILVDTRRLTTLDSGSCIEFALPYKVSLTRACKPLALSPFDDEDA